MNDFISMYGTWNSRTTHKWNYLMQRISFKDGRYLYNLTLFLLFINKLIMRKNKAIHFDFRFIHFQ